MEATRIEKVLALRSEGLSYAQVAKRLGVTRGVVSGLIYRHDNPRPQRTSLWIGNYATDEFRIWAVGQMDRYGWKAAAEKTGVTWRTLYRWRNRLRAVARG